MREIKFRAWDKERNRITETPFNIGGTGRICGVAFFENDLIPVEVIANESKRYVVMQFTGLKDKNGVEIYAGDIVKDRAGFLYSVIWRKKKARFAYKCQEGSKTNMNQQEDIKDGIEVIGNIYENPELLEQQ